MPIFPNSRFLSNESISVRNFNYFLDRLKEFNVKLTLFPEIEDVPIDLIIKTQGKFYLINFIGLEPRLPDISLLAEIRRDFEKKHKHEVESVLIYPEIKISNSSLKFAKKLDVRLYSFNKIKDFLEDFKKTDSYFDLLLSHSLEYNKGFLATIIIPVFNEGRYINEILKKLPESRFFEIIFVDDGSTDNTLEILKNSEKRIKVISLNRNLGFVSSFIEGYKKSEGNIVIALEPDEQFNPIEVYKLSIPILKNKADIVIGSKYLNSYYYKRSFKTQITESFFELIMYLLFRIRIRNILSGFRAFRREVLDDLKVEKLRMNWFTFSIKILYFSLLKGYRVKEISFETKPKMYIYPKIKLMKLLKYFILQILSIISLKYLYRKYFSESLKKLEYGLVEIKYFDIGNRSQHINQYNLKKQAVRNNKKDIAKYLNKYIELKKLISPPEIEAYTKTNMKIKIILSNQEIAKINNIEIFERLPKDFVPPQIEEINLIIENPDGEIKVHEREELIEKMTIEPHDQDPDNSHDVLVKLNNLAKFFVPNSKLIMTYDFLAKNPKPEVKYNTPLEIRGNISIPGKFFVISPPEEPVIKIKYVKRKLKTLKSIRSGKLAGEVEITIRVQNKGAAGLKNIEVIDRIPSGFKLKIYKGELKYKIKSVNNESEIVFLINELKGKESVIIKFTCSGEGDYLFTGYPVVIMRGSRESEIKKEITSRQVVSQVSKRKEKELYEIFLKIDKKINRGINARQLGETLENFRDDLPSGPILHQFMRFARELIRKGDKRIIDAFEEEIRNKIKNFKAKYT